jgi:16S rRNA (guanine966-N2)-methyltransferase
LRRKTKTKIKTNTTAASNQLRIIGGQWRGRKLCFADGEGLRPTLDRVRETLFNWLQYNITGARCFDPFSGSGALGLEALSRYAGEVVMLDTNPAAIRCIQENLTLLCAENASLFNMDARDYLQQRQAIPFDIAFLDPPFNQQLLIPLINLLEGGHWLKKGSLIYIEVEKNLGRPAIPETWEMLKEKKAGQLGYYLAVVNHARSLGC